MSRGSRPRGTAIALYAAAFLTMLASGIAIVMASLGSLQSTRVLWLSAGLSYVAIVLAVVGSLVPGREEP